MRLLLLCPPVRELKRSSFAGDAGFCRDTGLDCTVLLTWAPGKAKGRDSKKTERENPDEKNPHTPPSSFFHEARRDISLSLDLNDEYVILYFHDRHEFSIAQMDGLHPLRPGISSLGVSA